MLWFVDPFIGDWDGLDYTILSLAGYPSSMALGRNLFIFENHALYQVAHRLFNVQPENAYLIFKYAVVAQAPLAIIACWVLARDLTRSLYSATLAALLLVFSPVFVLYGGQVMTDVPSVLFLALALIIHYRGLTQRRAWLVFAGAALMGFGVNLRETIAFFAPWLLFAPFVCGWRSKRREILIIAGSLVVFLFCALVWFGYWYLTDVHYRAVWFGWRQSMAEEIARHPVTIANLRPFFAYFFVSAPLVFLSLIPAIYSEWRRQRISPLLLLACVGLFADLLLFLNYSTAVNWRYFLTGLPALIPLSADFTLRVLRRPLRTRRNALVATVTLMLTLAIVFTLLLRPASKQFIARRAMSRDYRYALAKLPRDAVMISGAQTVAVNYWKAIGLGEWQTIGTGGGWPGDKLVSVIDRHLTAGQRVFLDADPRWWLPCGWQRDEIPAIVGLQQHFRFRKTTETIYELRTERDATATDEPALEKLLPVNRPEDTRKCPPISN